MKKEDYDWIENERSEYRKRNSNQSSERSVRKVEKIGDQQPHKSLISTTPSMSSHSTTINSSNTSIIMGGRNKQAAKRGFGRRNAASISVIQSKRKRFVKI